MSTAAGSARAENCFVKIRVGETRAPTVARAHPPRHRAGPPHPAHRAQHARHIVRRARPRPVATLAAAEPPAERYGGSSLAQQTIPIYVTRPTSCDAQPAVALQSAPPARAVTPAQRLLDELAGPPARVADAGAPGASPGGFLPGGGGPLSSGGLTPGGAPPLVGPGGPVAGPPDTLLEIVTAPGVTPPDTTPPLVTPPEAGQPPLVIVGLPEGGQPPVIIPTTPPVTAVPEPGTWGLMILGAFGAGGALRWRRAISRRVSSINRKPNTEISR